MRWAGARAEVFPAIKKDFGAIETKLKQNHRSASSLVAVQAVVARRIDATAPAAEAVGQGANAPAECLLLEYNDSIEEAADLAARIDQWIRDDNLDPRDICVLTRQTPGIYGSEIIRALDKLGRRARVEQALQDLLSEPLTTALLDLLHLAIEARAPASWVRATELLERLDPSLRVADKASELLTQHLDQLKAALDRGVSVTEIVDTMTAFLGEARFRAFEPTYRAGSLYAETKAAFASSLERARDGRAWREAVAELEGVGAIPILTAHKSKGLEYHTILFVGLEDSAHWGFAQSPEEETSVFFVALSRAKRRVVATFADKRVTRVGGRLEEQSHESIQSFYDALAEAGVHAVRVGPKP
jgi:ATP-dependent DNA helicase UvrD/PcrA